MSEIKWIKIYIDMFDHKKIKFIRKNIPDGDSVALIWCMLLCLAGKCNAGGYIFLTESIPYTEEMLANELDFQLNTVKLALETFKKLKMASAIEGIILIEGWEEYQNLEKMEDLRQKNKEKVAKYRERQKKLLPCNVTSNQNVTKNQVTCNHDVTQSNLTDKDRELELENTPPPSPPQIEKNLKAEEGEFFKFLEILNHNADYPYSDQADKQLYKHLRSEFPEIDILKRVSEWLEINQLNMREKTRPRIIEFFKKKPPGGLPVSPENSENNRARIQELFGKSSILTDPEWAKAVLSGIPHGKPSIKVLRAVLEIQYVHKFNPQDFWITEKLLNPWPELVPEINKLKLAIEKDFEGLIK